MPIRCGCGRRYHAEEMLPRIFRRERPGGRTLVLDGKRNAAPAARADRVRRHLELVAARRLGLRPRRLRAGAARRATARCSRPSTALQLFAGFCYTQFADTYQEANGLLRGDRTPKFPIEEIFAATSGLSAPAVDPDPTASSPRQLPPTDSSEAVV